MLPDFTMNDFPDGSWVHAVFPCEGALGNSSCRVTTADFTDLCFRQLGVSVLLTAGSTFGMCALPTLGASCGSPLLCRVVHIIGMSSEKKMARVLTRRGIAMMKNTESGRNRTASNRPSGAMSVIVFPPNPKTSITIRRFARLPRPTLVASTDTDLRPRTEECLAGRGGE